MLRSHHHYHLRAFVKLSLVGCLLREWIYVCVYIYIHSCDLTEFTSPYSSNTQQGWHTSKLTTLFFLNPRSCTI